jgi:cytochrome P450
MIEQRPMPGPTGYPIIGVLPYLMSDPLTFYSSLPQKYPDIASYRMGPIRMYAVHNPDFIRHVLQDNYANYPKGAMWDGVREVFGNGLATSEGDMWLRQRRLMQPAFHRERIANLATLMNTVIEGKLRAWQSVAAAGQPVNMAVEMAELTFQIMVNTLFSTSISSDEFIIMHEALHTAVNIMSSNFWTFFLPDWFPKPGQKQMLQAIGRLDRLVYRAIEERRRQPDLYDDLMDMLIYARYEDSGEGMISSQLRDEVLTIFTAGHETTANTMLWTWYLLAQHPDVEERLLAEIDTILQGQPPTLATLRQLTYSKQVVQEVLRLYPTVWNMPRTVLADDTLGNYPLEQGSMLMINTYGLHRHPDLWHEPQRFNPNRFENEPTRFAYIPFGGGPHGCIGGEFAMMETQLILVQILQHFRLRPVPDFAVKVKGKATLVAEGGIPMTIERR